MGIYKPLIISVLVHLTLVLVVHFMPTPERPHSDLIEFEILPSSNKKEQLPVVQFSKAPENLRTEENEDPLKFWSQEKQRVIKQMRAKITGLTRNRSLSGGEDSGDRGQTQHHGQDKREFDPFGGLKPRHSLGNKNYERGVSTFGNDMDQLQIGEMTSLNTDRYLYYSFYSRFEIAFRQRWEPRIYQAIRMLPDSVFQNTANDKWITDVEIWLEKNGELHSVHLLKGSGINLFDSAIDQALVEAKMFPNPPKDKIEDDGLVKLKYRFTILHNPTLTARIRE